MLDYYNQFFVNVTFAGIRLFVCVFWHLKFQVLQLVQVHTTKHTVKVCLAEVVLELARR